MNTVPTTVMTTTAMVSSAIRGNSINIHTNGGKTVIIIIARINFKVYYIN
jgi:hypothetical protein